MVILIRKSHFTYPNNVDKRVLRSKHNNLSDLSNLNIRKPSPLSCVLFQNDYLLISAGATDGLIKGI